MKLLKCNLVQIFVSVDDNAKNDNFKNARFLIHVFITGFNSRFSGATPFPSWSIEAKVYKYKVDVPTSISNADAIAGKKWREGEKYEAKTVLEVKRSQKEIISTHICLNGSYCTIRVSKKIRIGSLLSSKGPLG